MTWGDWVTLAGAGITLLGAVRSLAPLGGWRAAFPAKVHRAAGVVLRRFRRRPPSVTGHAASTLPALRMSAHGTAHAFPDATSDLAGFADAVLARLATVDRDLGQLRGELTTERADRETAVQTARDAAAEGLAVAVADTKRVEVSGVRWQLVGVVFVVAGVVANAVTGG